MLLRGKPVSGVGLQVGDYVLQARTNASGQFNYRVDTTLPERHVATVTNVTQAKVGGKPLSAADKSALLAHARRLQRRLQGHRPAHEPRQPAATSS